jgi:hypothetical protein
MPGGEEIVFTFYKFRKACFVADSKADREENPDQHSKKLEVAGGCITEIQYLTYDSNVKITSF